MTQQPEGDEVAGARGSARASNSTSSESLLANIFVPVASLAGSIFALGFATPKQGKLAAFALFAIGCILGLYFILKKEKRVSDALLSIALPFVLAVCSWKIPEWSATPKGPAGDPESKVSQPASMQGSEKVSLGIRTVVLSSAGDGEFPDLVGDRRYGLKVESVDKGGAAFKAGIAARDIIQQVNSQEIKTRADLESALEQFCFHSSSVILGVWRNGRAINLVSICPTP